MRIGLDFSFLAVGPQDLVRGIPRFAQEQLLSVLRLDSENTYLLLCDAGADVTAIPAEIGQASNAQIIVAPEDLAQSPAPFVEERTLLARFSEYQRWLSGLHLDLFHTTCSAMLIGPLMPGFDVCPYVATAHDLIPLLYPAQYLPDSQQSARYQQRLLFLQQATRIAANSQATAGELVEHLGVPANRIDVTPPAPSPWFRPLPAGVARGILTSLAHPTRRRSRQRVRIPAEFVLAVTDLHFSKNVTTLVSAYAGLRSRLRARYPLVVAGHLNPSEVDTLRRLADQLGVGEELVVTGRVSGDELSALYSCATITVHPSHHEGFGFPVVEAMSCGSPVITTTRSALPETAGDAAVLVDSDDTASLTHAIDRLLHDSERRDDLRLRGLAQAARFTPEEFGRSTLRCYEKALAAGRVTSGATRVALWSPIPPQETAISLYTDDLVSGLAADPGLELDVFVDDDVMPPLHLMRAARVHHRSDFERAVRQRPFDAVVYQVSGSRAHAYMESAMLHHPGIVVLHDLRWSRALRSELLSRSDGVERFREALDVIEGGRAARDWDRVRSGASRTRAAAELRFLDEHPMLRPIVEAATQCVAVNPVLARELVRRYPQARSATVIPVGVGDPLPEGLGRDRIAARAYLGLARDAFIVLAPVTDVRFEDIEETLLAFAGLRPAGVDALLTLVGAPQDPACNAEVLREAERLNVGDAVRVSSRLPRGDLEAHLTACDVLLQLGDSTAASVPDMVTRALAAGRCVLMSDSPASRSLPDAACLRIVPDAAGVHVAATAALRTLSADEALRHAGERAARAHHEAHAKLEPMLDGYRALIREHARGRTAFGAGAHRPAPAGAPLGRPAPRSAALAYSKVCELEDFGHPQLRDVIRDACAHKLGVFGARFPIGFEYRKDWEVAMAVRTLADHGALRADARVLGVAAGMEDTIFYLTRHAGEVVAVDRYLSPAGWEETAPTAMLDNPAQVAPFTFKADRLTVQHMDARILDFPDASFDGIFSSGSIEHFGDLQTVAAAAYEMGRVLKPGGILTLSTELLLLPDTGAAGSSLPKTLLLSPAELQRYIIEASGLEPVDELDLSVSHWTRATWRPIVESVLRRQARCAALAGTGHVPEWACWDMPHIVMDFEDKRFTSVHLALRRAPVHPVVDNSWARPDPALRADVARHAVIATGAAEGAAHAGSGNGAAPVAAVFGGIRELVRKRDLAEKRVKTLISEAGAASADVIAELHEASLPQPGVYGPPPPYPAPEVAPQPGTTVACAIASTISPPYTVLVHADADDIISRVYLAGRGAEINTNLTSLVLALVPEGGVFLDIGANLGSMALPLAVSGRYALAVEAAPENAALLEQSAQRSGVAGRVRVVCSAVGDHVGEARFVPHGCHGQLVDGDVGGATTVPLVTIDALVECERLQRLDLVKIDVEGADFDVLRGMPRLAQREDAPALLVECCPYTLAAYGHTAAELVSLLEAYGYVVYNVDNNRLMRRHPDEVQVTTVMDVLAVRRGITRLPGWRVEPPIGRAELVDRLAAESVIWNPDNRATAARVARELHPDVLRLPAVAQTLDRLAGDAEPMVRAAAAWWRSARTESGVVR